jgi:hypothetical protein
VEVLAVHLTGKDCGRNPENASRALAMFGKGWTRKAFGQRIGHILRTCAFQHLDVAIASSRK